MDICMSSSIPSIYELWTLLPLMVIVFFGSYKMNMLTGYKKDAAIREAYWWCAGFFCYAVMDYFLLEIIPIYPIG